MVQLPHGIACTSTLCTGTHNLGCVRAGRAKAPQKEQTEIWLPAKPANIPTS